MQDKQKGKNIKIKNLSKEFDELKVLSNVDLTIKQGEFIAIVGRSGCGKSTLLRLVAGLESPTEGNIYLDEHHIHGINEDTRFLFQEARLLPWKKVIDNVQIGAGNRDREISKKALSQVGLEDRSNNWPSVLSGGQKQRVALARALAANPRLLLLDEPFGALDALTRIEMQQLIERLWQERKFTVILVTHDVSEAVALADRVLLIDRGKVTMDTKITLARPRQRNNDFVYFEKQILDRVMDKGEDVTEKNLNLRKVEYSI
jgi:sulfonate transport system ATP-binding protein